MYCKKITEIYCKNGKVIDKIRFAVGWKRQAWKAEVTVTMSIDGRSRMTTSEVIPSEGWLLTTKGNQVKLRQRRRWRATMQKDTRSINARVRACAVQMTAQKRYY